MAIGEEAFINRMLEGKTERLKVLDLFSGIGGFSLGLESTGGFETVAFCEIDKHCHEILRKHWPRVPIFTDVAKLQFERVSTKEGRDLGNCLLHRAELEFEGEECFDNFAFTDIDVICGGFPCQDISVAGKKKGLFDEEKFANAILEGLTEEEALDEATTRSGLWRHYKRLIGAIKPKYVLIENVANLRSNGLVTVLQDLWTLGYSCEWHIISARSVGACHLRERIWIIAYSDSDSIRNEQQRTEIGWNDLQDEGQDEFRLACEEWNVEPSDSISEGLEGQRFSSGIQQKNSTINSGLNEPSYSDHLRLWRSFTTEEEKFEWWSKATSRFRDWWEAESSVRGISHGISHQLDTPNKIRKQRIKQLGNAVVPFIPELIGNLILEYEDKKNEKN